jgi:Ankyrin repeat
MPRNHWFHVSTVPFAYFKTVIVYNEGDQFCRRAGLTRHPRMTGLHCAAANGYMDIVTLLLERGAPLEAKNTWGGTVLDSTVYFALHHPVHGVNYPAVIETLIAAGADVRAVTYSTRNRHVDEVLQRHGARPG